MTERQQPVGNPDAAAKRGIVLQVDGGRMLVQYFDGTKRWETAPSQLHTPLTPSERPPKSSRVRFDHKSEQQFARLMDFYEIAWEYEPRTFELVGDAEEGRVQFAPDFYLPAFDLFIEVTTRDQELVTRKNRMVRRLGDQYPSVKCKVLYQQDYVNLLKKYGLEDVIESDDEGAESGRVAASRDDFKALITAA